MRAWEDVCEDQGFGDLHAQISPKNQLNKARQRYPKNLGQNIHWFSKKSVLLSHMGTFNHSTIKSNEHQSQKAFVGCRILFMLSLQHKSKHKEPGYETVASEFPDVSFVPVPEVLGLGFPCPACLYKHIQYFHPQGTQVRFYKANKVC